MGMRAQKLMCTGILLAILPFKYPVTIVTKYGNEFSIGCTVGGHDKMNSGFCRPQTQNCSVQSADIVKFFKMKHE